MVTKIKHEGPVRSEWANLYLTRRQADRIAEAIQTRHEAFAQDHGTSYAGHELYAITNPGPKRSSKGFTIKVRGCKVYRDLMLAACYTEASVIDAV